MTNTTPKETQKPQFVADRAFWKKYWPAFAGGAAVIVAASITAGVAGSGSDEAEQSDITVSQEYYAEDVMEYEAPLTQADREQAFIDEVRQHPYFMDFSESEILGMYDNIQTFKDAGMSKQEVISELVARTDQSYSMVTEFVTTLWDAHS